MTPNLSTVQSFVVALEAERESATSTRPGSLEAMRRDVEALRMAVTPHGESVAETTRDSFQELRTDLQALAVATREMNEAVTRLMTDSVVPATPVLLEILAELRRPTKGDLKVQRLRGLPPFSFTNFVGTQSEALGRERTQAITSSFHDLD